MAVKIPFLAYRIPPPCCAGGFFLYLLLFGVVILLGMQKKKQSFVEEVVQLTPKYLNHIYGVKKANEVKFFRPFLVLELDYKGQKRLFGIPQFSNIDNNRNKMFYDRIPHRLQTRQGLHHGFSYSDMIPLVESGISRVKRPEQLVPKSPDVRRTLMLNILNRTPERWNEKLTPKALNAYKYMYNQISQKGMSCFGTKAMNEAYHAITVCVFQSTQKVLNKGLSPDENGIRPFYKKAQNYIDKHYLPFINGDNSVLMPKFFTDIDGYVAKADAFGLKKK